MPGDGNRLPDLVAAISELRHSGPSQRRAPSRLHPACAAENVPRQERGRKSASVRSPTFGIHESLPRAADVDPARDGAPGTCCLPQNALRLAFRKMHCVGTQNRKLSRLNGWPMRSPLTLRRDPRGPLRMTRGRCGSLLLHRKGLAPSSLLAGLPALRIYFPECPKYRSPWAKPFCWTMTISLSAWRPVHAL
jgi:hypothetical protein